MNSRKAVFIDRDGVVNDLMSRGDNFFVAGKRIAWSAPYNFEEFRIKESASEALALIKQTSFLSILVTNQPDLSYGMISPEEYKKIMGAVQKLGFDDIFVCLHKRDGECMCRKPKPGMLYDAQKKWNIDLNGSYIVGDTQNDMEAGRAAGCLTILVKADYNDGVEANFKASDLLDAAKLIFRMEKGGIYT